MIATPKKRDSEPAAAARLSEPLSRDSIQRRIEALERAVRDTTGYGKASQRMPAESFKSADRAPGERPLGLAILVDEKGRATGFA